MVIMSSLLKAIGLPSDTRARCGANLKFWGGGLSRLFHLLHAPYRPEFHYMRGPGPKCREKHDEARAKASTRDPE